MTSGNAAIALMILAPGAAPGQRHECAQADCYQWPEREMSLYATATGCLCRAVTWTTVSPTWRAFRRIRIAVAGILQATMVVELSRPIAKVTLT